jgi:two-component system chemotaxis sensor kinase CheA
MDQLLRDFLDEVRDNLAGLDDALARLAAVAERDGALTRIFRVIHTIKGTSGFLGLPRLQRAAHAAENVLERLRDGSIAVTPAAIGLVAEHLDRMRLIVSGVADSGVEPDLDETPGPDGGPRADRPAVATLETASVRIPREQIAAVVSAFDALRRARDGIAALAAGQPALESLDLALAMLGDRIARLRTAPLGNAWIGLRRLARDLGAELGKSLELELHGAELELDRRAVELLKDPMIHLVRNAADHGIETPAERHAAGKAETGRIAIRAVRHGDEVAIEMSDDGRGLQIGRIRARAVDAGLVAPEAAAALSDRELSRLAFRAGLSTAERLTGVSGRGFGLDVVMSNVQALGGTIDIRTSPGQGTRFSIRIPDAPAAIPSPDDQGRRRGRLLLLDDSGGFRDLVEPLLAAAGYEVVTAATASALSALGRDSPGFDLVLLDKLMPEAESGALDAALAADPALAELPVLVLGAGGTDDRAGPSRRRIGPVERTDSAAILARIAAVVGSRGTGR